MTVEHAGSTTNVVGIPEKYVRAPGKAYSPREDVLKSARLPKMASEL